MGELPVEPAPPPPLPPAEPPGPLSAPPPPPPTAVTVEKPEPKKLTIIDIIFIWFYIVNGFTITAFSLSSLITEKIHYYTSGFLKFVIPVSLISIAIYLYKRVQNNRKDIILDRDL